MSIKRIYVSWLLLLVMLLAASMTLSVEPSQAHYSNTVVWNTVLPFDESPVSSDCLIAEGQQTILLGEIPQEGKEITFTLEAAQSASGVLTWTVDKPEYLTVQMQKMDLTGNGTLDADPSVALEELDSNYPVLQGGSQVTVTLLLTPGTSIPEETEVNVTVQWGTLLHGIFRGTVPKTQDAVVDPDEEQTDHTGGGDSQGDATGENPEEATEPVPVSEETEQTDPTEGPIGSNDGEITIMSLTDTQSEETVTGGTDTTDETTSDGTLSDGTTSDGTTSDDTTSDGTASDGTGSETTSLQVVALGSFSSDGWLPVSIQPMGNSDRLVLSVKSAEDTAARWEAFPSYTRYSVDGGESWYLLYESDYITIDTGSAEPVMLLLDFSWKARSTNGSLLLQTEEYSEDTVQESCAVKTTPSMDLSALQKMQFLSQDQKSVEVSIPTGWEHCTLQYNVEMLCADNEGNAVYEEVTLSAESLNALYTPAQSGEAGKMTLQIGESLPPAGTYRLNMSWTYKGLCFHETQTTFFINYSNYTQSEGTGGAEQ